MRLLLLSCSFPFLCALRVLCGEFFCRRKTGLLLFVIGLGVVLLAPSAAYAYIGPGAGFALAGSFLAVFAAFCSALLMAITWPIRLITRSLFGWKALRRSRVKRVVILGLDGLDHGLTTK